MGEDLLVIGVLMFAAGAIAATLVGLNLARHTMIVTRRSDLGLENTVETIERNTWRHGWIVTGTRDLMQTLETHGVGFPHGIKLVELSNPRYTAELLHTHRQFSCLVPSTISVWEGDDGHIYVSQMNTGLMAKLFGGTVGRVMGVGVAREERAILEAVEGG